MTCTVLPSRNTRNSSIYHFSSGSFPRTSRTHPSHFHSRCSGSSVSSGDTSIATFVIPRISGPSFSSASRLSTPTSRHVLLDLLDFLFLFLLSFLFLLPFLFFPISSLDSFTLTLALLLPYLALLSLLSLLLSCSVVLPAWQSALLTGAGFCAAAACLVQRA